MTSVRSQDRKVLDHLRKVLAALKSGPPPAWPRIGRFLDGADACRLWEAEGAASLSAWVRSLAQSLGRQERTLWRYLAAQRAYKRLRAQLTVGPLAKQRSDAARLRYTAQWKHA